MRVKHAEVKRKMDIWVYLLTCFLIFSSKTVFFGVIHMEETLLVTLITSIVAMLLNTKFLRVNKKLIQTLFVFILFLVVVSLFYVSDILVAFNSYIGAIILFIEVLLIGALYVNIVSKEKFILSYVHLMFVIASISLIYFFWSIISPHTVLSHSNIYINGSSQYIALPWYTFGWKLTMDNGYIYDYLFGRNAGPFWEPGAFQGFLFIGLFLLLRYREWFKHRTLLMIVYLLTLLTTQSTTGYLILLISLFGFAEDYIDCLFGKTNLK